MAPSRDPVSTVRAHLSRATDFMRVVSSLTHRLLCCWSLLVPAGAGRYFRVPWSRWHEFNAPVSSAGDVCRFSHPNTMGWGKETMEQAEELKSTLA
jgi:hypothetical protein